MTDPIDESRRKKILYRAQHRGFKEADLLIGGFAAENLAGMSDADLADFEELIDLPDHDIYAFVLGGAPPSANDGPALAALRAFHAAKGR